MAKISRGDGEGGGMRDGIEICCVEEEEEARGVNAVVRDVGGDGVGIIFSDLMRNGGGEMAEVSVSDVSGVVFREAISSSLDGGLILETLAVSLLTEADEVEDADEAVASADRRLNSFLLFANQFDTTCGETTSFGIRLTPFLSN